MSRVQEIVWGHVGGQIEITPAKLQIAGEPLKMTFLRKLDGRTDMFFTFTTSGVDVDEVFQDFLKRYEGLFGSYASVDIRPR